MPTLDVGNESETNGSIINNNFSSNNTTTNHSTNILRHRNLDETQYDMEHTSSSLSRSTNCSDEIEVPNEISFELLDDLNNQKKLYKVGPQEDYCSDTEKCIHRYFKTIYRQAKFFSDSLDEFKFADFVVAAKNPAETKQCVQICNWLLSNIGKKHYNISKKIMFWKTYWKPIYKEMGKLRMGDINKFKNRFITGKMNYIDLNKLNFKYVINIIKRL